METDTDSKEKGEELDEVLEVLEGAPHGMNVESIVAVLALEREIEVEQTLVDLLKQGKITARYKGDKSKDVDSHQFVFSIADSENETGE